MPEKLLSGPIWFHLEIEDLPTFPRARRIRRKRIPASTLKRGKCSIQTGRFRLYMKSGDGSTGNWSRQDQTLRLSWVKLFDYFLGSLGLAVLILKPCGQRSSLSKSLAPASHSKIDPYPIRCCRTVVPRPGVRSILPSCSKNFRALRIVVRLT